MEENTQTEEVTTRSVGMRYGLYSGLVGILMFLIPAMLSMNPFDNMWNWIGAAVGILLFVLAHKYFKDEGNGFMSYGQGIGIAFWMALISTLMTGLFTLAYLKLFDNLPFEMMLDAQAMKMEEAGSPDNQIQIAREWTARLFWPMYFIIGIVGSIVIALIVTIFTQKKSPEPFV